MAKGADVPRAAELHARLLAEVLEAITDGLAVFDEEAGFAVTTRSGR
jgi:hypothetical protein